MARRVRGADLCWALGGDNLQFYPIFALFSTLGGWTSTTIFFFQVSKLSEDTKKKVFTKIERLFFPNSSEDQKKEKKVFARDGIRLFPPNSSEDQRSDADQSQIIAGDGHVDHTQIIGGGCSQIIRGIYPPHPRVSAPLRRVFTVIW